MKKQKIGALVLALSMLSSVALVGCKKEEETSWKPAPAFEMPTTTTTVPEGGYEQVEVSKPEVVDGVPSVIEWRSGTGRGRSKPGQWRSASLQQPYRYMEWRKLPV